MSIDKAEADLANLEARANTLEAELAVARAEIDRIKIYLELSRRYGVAGGTSAHANGKTEDPIPALTIDEGLAKACRGKSIPDAAIALIRLAGHPLSEEEIVDGLRRAGVTLVSDAPVVNLRFALLRKRKETGAVWMTDDKSWDANPVDSDQEDQQSGFVQNRDRNLHAEKSRIGLLAARNRGVKNGRRSKITPEIKALVNRLLKENVTQKEIARQAGVTIQTFHRWCAVGLVGRDVGEDTKQTTHAP